MSPLPFPSPSSACSRGSNGTSAWLHAQWKETTRMLRRAVRELPGEAQAGGQAGWRGQRARCRQLTLASQAASSRGQSCRTGLSNATFRLRLGVRRSSPRRPLGRPGRARARPEVLDLLILPDPHQAGSGMEPLESVRTWTTSTQPGRTCSDRYSMRPRQPGGPGTNAA